MIKEEFTLKKSAGITGRIPPGPVVNSPGPVVNSSATSGNPVFHDFPSPSL